MVTAVAGGDDNVIAFTAHELGYLLGLVKGEPSTRAISLLGIPTPEYEDEFVLAGAATLLVRGLAFVDANESLVPDDAAALIAELLSSDSSWIEVALLSEGASEAAFFIVSDLAAVVLSPRYLGIYEARFMKPETSRGAGLVAILFAFLQASAPAVAYVSGVVGVRSELSLALRLFPDGSFELSLGEGAEVSSGNIAGGKDQIVHKIVSLIDGSLSVGA